MNRYSELFRRPSFPAFLTAGALQFAAPSTVLVVFIFVVLTAYPTADRATYGAIALAFLGLSSAIPTFVAAFFSGALADRYDRGFLMRLVNLVSLLGVTGAAIDLVFAPGMHVGVPVAAGFYLPVWVVLIYPCWAAIIVTATIFRPSYNTAVPRLVETPDLGRANGLIYSTAALVSAGGTLVVGAILTYEPAAYALAFSFLLFFATQVVLVFVHVDLAVTRTGPPRSVAREAMEGFAYLRRRRELLEITIAALVVNFLAAVALVELGLYVDRQLGLATGIWYGAMLTASTLGVAAGFALISRFHFEPRAGRAIIVLTLLMGLSLFGLGLVRSIWFALPVIFVYGMMPGMIMTVLLSTVQATVPDAMMGRVFSADEVGSYALVPVGQFAGGVVTFELNVQWTYLAAGGAIVVFGLVMMTGFGALRRLGFHPHPEEAPAQAAPS
ncbi:MAG: MFS transporter [Thermoplasmata archaeon]